MNMDVSAAMLRYRCGSGLLALTALAMLLKSAPAATVPVPANIANGTTVLLQCGVIYEGTLALRGKTGVTIKTTGDCGKASISPRRAITGWTRHSGNIYSAPIGFDPVQVTIDTRMLAVAHWPNQGWATGTARMPTGALAGATLMALVNQSVIRSRTLTGKHFTVDTPFYVEGKLWMLDTPGEWAVRNGRLYAWAPDGRSPEGRAWATPDANGIDADGSTGIVIDDVAIFSATDGISAHGASRLTVRNTTITDSYRDGIWASGSIGLQVLGSSVANARRMRAGMASMAGMALPARSLPIPRSAIPGWWACRVAATRRSCSAPAPTIASSMSGSATRLTTASTSWPTGIRCCASA